MEGVVFWMVIVDILVLVFSGFLLKEEGEFEDGEISDDDNNS